MSTRDSSRIGLCIYLTLLFSQAMPFPIAKLLIAPSAASEPQVQSKGPAGLDMLAGKRERIPPLTNIVESEKVDRILIAADADPYMQVCLKKEESVRKSPGHQTAPLAVCYTVQQLRDGFQTYALTSSGVFSR